MTSSKKKLSKSPKDKAKIFTRSSPEVFSCGDMISLSNFAGTCFYKSIDLQERDGENNVMEALGKTRREFLIFDYLGSEEYIVPGIDEGVRDFYLVFHLGSGTVGIIIFWEEDKMDLEVLHSSSEEVRNHWPQEGSSPPNWLHLR